MRGQRLPRRGKLAGTWTCLLLLGWALTFSWLGHTCMPRCSDGVCQLRVGGAEARVPAVFGPEVDGSAHCLACQLLQILQTVTAANAPAALELAVAEAATPPTAATSVVLLPTGGSARAPPTI